VKSVTALQLISGAVGEFSINVISVRLCQLFLYSYADNQSLVFVVHFVVKQVWLVGEVVWFRVR